MFRDSLKYQELSRSSGAFLIITALSGNHKTIQSAGTLSILMNDPKNDQRNVNPSVQSFFKIYFIYLQVLHTWIRIGFKMSVFPALLLH